MFSLTFPVFTFRWLTLEENLLTCVPNEIEGSENVRHLNLSHDPFEKFPDLKDLNVRIQK